jgi:hypothetical protein
VSTSRFVTCSNLEGNGQAEAARRPVDFNSSLQSSADRCLRCGVLLFDSRFGQCKTTKAATPQGFQIWYQVRSMMVFYAHVGQPGAFEKASKLASIGEPVHGMASGDLRRGCRANFHYRVAEQALNPLFARIIPPR